MWLFFVETYIFVLIAFTVGVVVGLVGVRLGVRRIAPPRGPKPPKAPKAAKAPAEKKKRGKRGAADGASAEAAEPVAAGESS